MAESRNDSFSHITIHDYENRKKDTLFSQWPNLEGIPACHEGMRLTHTFLEAAGECVNRLGIGRTSGTRAALLIALHAMERHGDECPKCNW
jgi:hypothetical protein